MIRYTVVWRKELIGELATLWTSYPDRAQISAAANRIDSELRIDAHLKGSVFMAGQSTISSGPLTAFFRVDEGDRKVLVEGILLTESN
jgi:hypothetical protein